MPSMTFIRSFIETGNLKSFILLGINVVNNVVSWIFIKNSFFIFNQHISLINIFNFFYRVT